MSYRSLRRGNNTYRLYFTCAYICVYFHIYSSPPFKQPVYDFTYLDALIDLLYNNGLRPGFELMGNPGNIFKNFEDKAAVYDWKDLITKTAQRYVGKCLLQFYFILYLSVLFQKRSDATALSWFVCRVVCSHNFVCFIINYLSLLHLSSDQPSLQKTWKMFFTQLLYTVICTTFHQIHQLGSIRLRLFLPV